jgi:hypothetical protein
MAGWRSAVLVAMTGLASGTLGAILYAHFAIPSPRLVSSRLERPEVQGPVIPPGWDRALVSRVSTVEQRLDEIGSRAPAPPASTKLSAASEPKDERTREQRRAEHYQKELDHLEKMLADHASEPNDDAWARPLATSMQQSLSRAFEGVAQTKNIDCRSKTCTATLSFPTPGAALASLQQSRKYTFIGCKGGSIIPTPPKSAGPYDLTVVYSCR